MATSFNSRQEAEVALRKMCDTAIEYLRELQIIHLAMDGPERPVTESESELVFPLRKVFFHVQAIASWQVGTDVLHVMAPDIRAAQEQLDPLFLEHLNDEQAASGKQSKHTARRDRVLGRLSHPTSLLLTYRPHLGGLHSDDVREFLELHLLLTELVNAYGLLLGAMADALGHSGQPKIVDVLEGATAQLTSVSLEALRPFLEETSRGGREEDGCCDVGAHRHDVRRYAPFAQS